MNFQRTLIIFVCAVLWWAEARAAEQSMIEVPQTVVIQATLDRAKVPKPAYLHHEEHLWLECEGCHHGKDANGRMVDYRPGDKVERCEHCHNSKAYLPEQIGTLKRAAHMLCLDCHRTQDPELSKCGVCHTKK